MVPGPQVCFTCVGGSLLWKLLNTPNNHYPTDGIVSTLKKQAGPASVVLQDEDDLEKFKSDLDASIIGEFQGLFY